MDSQEYYGDNVLAIDVLRNKYLAQGERGPQDMWDRVATAIASVEEDSEYWHGQFLSLLKDFMFIPGGRILHGAGRQDTRRKPTLSNCYVIPIEEDSLEGIYRCLSESALVYRTGGGVGTDLSILRPKGTPVNATVDASPGCTTFMNLLSESTNAVSQAGRRGALMLTLRVDHPDIEDFIAIKSDASRTQVQYANISVLITDEFMEAVEADGMFDLRWNGRVFRTVRARSLWDAIIKNAHASAEPGIIFWDTMRAYHNVEYAHPLTSTNPCGEQPLASYTACNLGTLNLTHFVDPEGYFDIDKFRSAVQVATRFLDDVIEYNMGNHALPKISEAVASDRRVGLGVTGLADMLVLMQRRYDSDEALETVAQVMGVLRDTAYETSVALAQEKGPFPLFDWQGVSQSQFIQGLSPKLREQMAQHGLRNSTLLTMPPVGTGSIVGQTSSGIEPIFQTSYTRRVKQENGQSFREYKVYHPLVKRLFGDDTDLPDYVVTAHEIDPYFRVRMQAVIQQYTDSSISSTINLPQDITVEAVADIYRAAHREGLKGVTIYREGSRDGVLLTDPAPAAGAPAATPPDADGFHHRRARPPITQGITERINTGEGKIYVTINEDEHGICEVFSTIGKSGGHAAAQSEAISRLISLALSAGIDPHEVAHQLKGISGPTPVWEDGELILSSSDAIGKALDRYLKRQGADPGSAPDEPTPSQGLDCPDCGVPTQATGSCHTCPDCGWSKC